MIRPVVPIHDYALDQEDQRFELLVDGDPALDDQLVVVVNELVALGAKIEPAGDYTADNR